MRTHYAEWKLIFEEKQAILKDAERTLKIEFVGIDRVIDEVIASVSSWFLFPDLQEKPLIINLWGLTGVGKSSLVNRLASLLDFENKYFHFDLGDKEVRSLDIKDKLKNIYNEVNGFPILIALDEFQHARTLDEHGIEIEEPSSRVIWQLLDSGKFQMSRFSFEIESIFYLVKKLRFLLKMGVKVSNGLVVSKAGYYADMMNLSDHTTDPDEKIELDRAVLFVPFSFHERIYDTAPAKYSSYYQVAEELERLNGDETIEYLLQIMELGNAPIVVDCSKALIFVMGNLDEAYQMTNDFNPDLDADEFHEQSLKIGITEIKQALKSRFRSEQIARLGNNHNIYPAFNNETFKRIIEIEFERVAGKVSTQFGIKLAFDPTLHDMIYQEGVYPTQGTRPVFSTINQMIQSNLGKIVSAYYQHSCESDEIRLIGKEGQVLAEFRNESAGTYILAIPVPWKLSELKKCKRDDYQAIVAVHESGHAIISALLLGEMPQVILSSTANSDSGGFVYSRSKRDFIPRSEILNILAFYLGGYIAEKVVFGEQNVTAGGKNDIESASNFIMRMLKTCGLGSSLASYWEKDSETRFYVHDEDNKLDAEAESWISTAADLAETTLSKHKGLLLKMADYLSDNRQMNKDLINDYISKYAVGPESLNQLNQAHKFTYRDHLKGEMEYIQKNLDDPVDHSPERRSMETAAYKQGDSEIS